MYTEASLCRAEMNHPHGRAKPNTLAAFYPPDVVQRAVAGLKAKQDGAVCCDELSEEPRLSRPLDAGMWHGDGSAQTHSREQSELDCKLFVVGWQGAG